jgi:hypothetical protein
MAKKQTEKNNTLPQTEWPVVKDGKFVCSDGHEFTDGYFAREHQKQLNKQ